MLSLIARANVRVGVRAMPWPEALPFYAAVIAGPSGDATADAANPSRSKPSRIVDAITYIFVLASVGAAFYWLIRPDVIWAFLYAWLCGSVLTQLILARDKGRTLAMNRRAVDHYLPLFEKLHRGAALSMRERVDANVLVASIVIGPFAWLAYRKMPILATCLLALPMAIRAVLTATGISTETVNGFQLETILAVALNFVHGPIYYWKATRLVDGCLALPGKPTLQQVGRRGGTNQWSWTVLFVLSWGITFLPLQIDLWKAGVASVPAARPAQARINMS